MDMLFRYEMIKKSIEGIAQQIEEAVFPLKSMMKKGEYTSIAECESNSEPWIEIGENQKWGSKDTHCWFKFDVTIPENFQGKKIQVNVKSGATGWDATNPQFIVWVNGDLKQGLDMNHTSIILSDSAVAGQTYNININGYSGMNAGQHSFIVELVAINNDAFDLFFDMSVPQEAAELLDEKSAERVLIINHLVKACDLIDFRKKKSAEFYDSCAVARKYLKEEFYEKECGKSYGVATCVGHTHIDVAWLWRICQTREKTCRSFSTVLDLMNQYPEYIFMSSQPQLYKYVKEDHPDVYEKIKQRISEGRWEPEGAMWLEADCNVTSGESLVRQVLFGKRFFMKEFGVDSKILWLPDVFGYSAALPQILKKAGVDYFMTTKIGWNEYNQIPMDSFKWQGMDGTEILTHFITSKDYRWGGNEANTTYNATINAANIQGAYKRYQQKDIIDEVLICYGFGDGGGGATYEMLEHARRLEMGIPGIPKLKQGKSLDFFNRLETKKAKLPKWVGELYLEYHRGTYTSMARNKKYNRKSEFIYQDAELLWSMVQFATGEANYPQETINDGWETILLNQFHDILPGSSIKEVYDDSKLEYEDILKKARILTQDAISKVAGNIELSQKSVVVFNQTAKTRDDICEFDLPIGWKSANVYDKGILLDTQITLDGKVIFFAEGVPAKGFKAFEIKAADVEVVALADYHNIQNDYLNIEINDSGNLSSIIEKKTGREVVKAGEQANVFQIFEDRPLNYNAWDINIYYQNKMWEVDEVEAIEMIETGKVRTVVRVVKRFMDSTIAQDIILYAKLPRLDFKTTVDWKESELLLKAAFPMDIHCEKATYEIQYGNVERPTHWNTSWDMAKFEVCAHKWADISEDGFGVSLLNDCKYGHDIKDNVMRLTLLKSAIDPNPDADREVHHFTYSLYPHVEGWKNAGTIDQAYNLNCPLYSKVEEAHSGKLSSQLSMVNISDPNVVVEVVKKAEDSDHMIIRLYECFNRKTSSRISLFCDIQDAWECDLMENNINEMEVNSNGFDFDIKPYEIKTFKIAIKN